jgi:hypothetical protein
MIGSRTLLQGLFSRVGRRSHVTLRWGVVQVMVADVHTSSAVATPFPLSLLFWLHTPSQCSDGHGLPILLLCWLGIRVCVRVAYGCQWSSLRPPGADRKSTPYSDTSTPFEQGLFWAPWRGLSPASRPSSCLSLSRLPLGWTRRRRQTYQDSDAL